MEGIQRVHPLLVGPHMKRHLTVERWYKLYRGDYVTQVTNFSHYSSHAHGTTTHVYTYRSDYHRSLCGNQLTLTHDLRRYWIQQVESHIAVEQIVYSIELYRGFCISLRAVFSSLPLVNSWIANLQNMETTVGSDLSEHPGGGHPGLSSNQNRQAGNQRMDLASARTTEA